MKKGQLTIGKWHFKLGLVPAYWIRNGMMFHFGIFKITNYPLEGEQLTKEHYKGFWIQKTFTGFEINLL